MAENSITIEKILELRGGSLEELRQYALSKGIDLPDNLKYILTPVELKAIDPILANITLKDIVIESDFSEVSKSAIREHKVHSQKDVFDNKKSTNKNLINRKFIGIVKFFDFDKDFGFIASNNCNMSESKYKQDFYVNSIGFIEDNAKREGCIVVFEVEKQRDGRKKAVNVRRISKSDEDIALALSYYGDHEYVDFKDGSKINLYCCIYKPVKLVAEKVKDIIIKDTERSPKRTTQHFVFFIEHYKQYPFSKDRYIFDRDISKGETSIWTSLFDVFTAEERIMALSIYPSLCRYFTNTNLLHQWIDTCITADCSLVELQKHLVKLQTYIHDKPATNR